MSDTTPEPTKFELTDTTIAHWRVRRDQRPLELYRADSTNINSYTSWDPKVTCFCIHGDIRKDTHENRI